MSAQRSQRTINHVIQNLLFLRLGYLSPSSQISITRSYDSDFSLFSSFLLPGFQGNFMFSFCYVDFKFLLNAFLFFSFSYYTRSDSTIRPALSAAASLGSLV